MFTFENFVVCSSAIGTIYGDPCMWWLIMTRFQRLSCNEVSVKMSVHWQSIASSKLRTIMV